MRKVGLQAVAARGLLGGRGRPAGREAVVPRRGRGGAAVVLGRRVDGSFLARGVAQDGLDVLVAALVRSPVRVAEALVDGVDVNLVDQLLMRYLSLGRSSHFGVLESC